MSDLRDIAMFCEGETLSTVCLPSGPNVHLSKKCADPANSPTGLAFTAALVKAADSEWQRWKGTT